MNHLSLLRCFIQHLKEKGAEIFQRALEEQLPIDRFVGEGYLSKPTIEVASTDPQRSIRFLKDMGVLSKADDIALTSRETQCIRYLLQGYTAAETAQLLELSKRTVEFYIENIKLKTNCNTKLELFEKFKELEALGLLLPYSIR